MHKQALATVMATVLLVAIPACNREPDGDPGIEGDTLEIAVPEDIDERFEEAGKAIGGAVGEAMEETGEAIEEAGERVQEEVADDTTDQDR